MAENWDLWNKGAKAYGFGSSDIAEWIKAGFSAGDVYQSYATSGAPPQKPPGPPPSTPAIGSTTQPESVALQQMAQIDPTSEALRTALGQSYLNTLGSAPTPVDPSRAQAPAAGDVQSYLDLYKKIDPQSYAQMGQLGGAMGSYLTNAQQQAALGTSLDPQTVRELEQSTRAGQMARGNVYGTPQLVQEAMTRGQAGMAIAQQRQAALGQAGQAMGGYLTSGATPGAIANQLYQQGYGRNLSTWQAQQAARQQAQQGALGYLGSGQTPYQAGASYLNTAENRAGMAAQGGPSYMPSNLGTGYTGAGAPSFPQYGIDVSQLSNQWYNTMNMWNQPGAAQKNPMMGAAAGALGGAASGALAGAAAGGVGAIPGAIIGGIGGGAAGYFS
jgi:hypothetical protein